MDPVPTQYGRSPVRLRGWQQCLVELLHQRLKPSADPTKPSPELNKSKIPANKDSAPNSIPTVKTPSSLGNPWPGSKRERARNQKHIPT